MKIGVPKYLWLALLLGVSAQGEELPSPAELEAQGAVIGSIRIDRDNVFDLTDPEQDRFLYRLANRWNVITRESVIRDQLLFAEGDRFEARLIEESERLLRQNAYLYDAKIEAVQLQNGVVDIRVNTRDLWTLMPGFSLSRSGGENRMQARLSERNLLGTGVSIRVEYRHDVDRDSTGFQYFDNNIGSSWTSLFLDLADNSDGHSNTLQVVRPFYALDARWSAGATIFDDDRSVSFYDLGTEVAEYRASTRRQTAFFGWSSGLQQGWVRRWNLGFVRDEREYLPVADGTLPALLPENREFNYPYVGFELLEDRFESTANRDQIDRTEDFFLGTRVYASVGYAPENFGSSNDAWLYNLDMQRGYGRISDRALLLAAGLAGRTENGRGSVLRYSLGARYYNQVTDKRLFFMTLNGYHVEQPDLDGYLVLGGDSGLRGYPLRYQTGSSRLLLTAEQRYYTDWYPFKLFRVGGAMFVDAGRTWGTGPTGSGSIGWLRDLGIGLRLVPTRASGRDVIHIDVAFPLDGDASIDEVQFLIESRRGF